MSEHISLFINRIFCIMESCGSGIKLPRSGSDPQQNPGPDPHIKKKTVHAFSKITGFRSDLTKLSFFKWKMMRFLLFFGGGFRSLKKSNPDPSRENTVPLGRTCMVLILDGNPQIGAHVRKQYLLFDLFKAFDYIGKSKKKLIFLSEKTYLPSYVRDMFWFTI